MASGKLGTSAPSASTNTTVYTVPASTLATLSINVVNRGTGNANVNIALTTSASPANADYIEYGVEVLPNGVLERSGIVASALEKVIVNSTTADCTFRVHGFEESV